MFRKILYVIVLFSLEAIYAQNGMNNIAPRIIDYPSSLSTTNDEARQLYNIGSDCLRNNDLNEAENNLLKAIAIDPNFYEALDHIALVYKRQNRLSEAEEMYLKSLAINPDNLIPYLNLANIYGFQKKMQETIEVLLKAIIVDPKYPEPYFQLASIFQVVGQFEISISYTKIAIELYLKENNTDELYYAYRMQGVNFLQIQKFEEAAIFFEESNVYFNDNEIKELVNNIREHISSNQ
ncbi:MAG: tetratricopeptide repeat protein [Spirochaetaceae bacterium]|jgi:tetratricopeptide (TPR) repeat protein|nr:tetratricopeptide repeat protein [Spirochaetaceae bacterium]